MGYAFYVLDIGDRAEVALAIADDYQGRGLGMILLGQLAEIAGANGIHVFEAVVAPENHRMLEVLRESGFPVEVRAGAGEMRDHLVAQGYAPAHFVVQRMVPEGVEMIVGVVHDSHFGPVVACGAGGTLAELICDVSVRLTPLTPEDATEMIRELKTFPLLTGFRGQPPGDIPALEETLLRVSALAEDLPEIVELDCNPIRVHPKGAVIVDARVRVAPCERPPLLGRRSGPFR